MVLAVNSSVGYSVETRLRPSVNCLRCKQGFARFYNMTENAAARTRTISVFHMPHGKEEPCEDQTYERA